VLRKEIIEDTGNSLLKKKCLDLITHLRLEQQILNDSKTGPHKGGPRNRVIDLQRAKDETDMVHSHGYFSHVPGDNEELRKVLAL
jgi:hypothetical protein